MTRRAAFFSISVLVVLCACQSGIGGLLVPPTSDEDAADADVDAKDAEIDATRTGEDASDGIDIGEDAGTDAGHVDAEPRDLSPGNIFDPAALIETSHNVQVFSQNDVGLVLGEFQMIWTGSKYLLVWQNDPGDGVHLVAWTIDPSNGYAVSPPRTVLTPTEAGADFPLLHSHVVWNGEQLAAFYLVWEKLYVVFTDGDGIRTADPVEVLVLEDQHFTSFGHGIWGNGYRVMLHHQLGTDLRIIKTSSTGHLESGYPVVFEDVFSVPAWFVSGLGPTPSGWDLAWFELLDPTSHQVKFVELSPSFEVMGRARTLISGVLGASFFTRQNLPPILLTSDLDGLHILQLGDTGLEPIWTDEGMWPNNRKVLHDPGMPRVAVVGYSHELEGTSHPPGLIFVSLDYQMNDIRPPVQISETALECISSFVTATAAQDRLGVAWTAGCRAPSLWFTELQAFK